MGAPVVHNPSLIGDPTYLGDMRSDAYCGNFFKEKNEAWIFSEDYVQIMNVDSGLITQEWKCNYGKMYYATEVVSGVNQFLVVAARASSEEVSYVIVVLNISSLSVVNVFFFHEQITCIISCGANFKGCCDSSLLRSFDGIIALGSYGGKVFLVDLKISQFNNLEPLHHPLHIKIINDRANNMEPFHDEHSTLQLLQGACKILF